MPSVSDVASVGAVRALEAAGKAEFAAASGLPGTPEGIDELKKGPGGSAFKVTAMTDIATQSWPIALGIYELQGGELPDVNVMQARLVTADNIDTVPSQIERRLQLRQLVAVTTMEVPSRRLGPACGTSGPLPSTR